MHAAFRPLALAITALAVLPSSPAQAAPDLSYTPIVSAEPLRDASFYLLTLLDATPATRAALAKDSDLARLDKAMRARLKIAARACEVRIETRGQAPALGAEACTIDAARWTAEESAAAEAAIARVFDRSAEVRRLVKDHMRPSGYFEFHAGKDDRALFLAAWADAQRAIDRIIRIYGHGEKPDRFADIDSIIYPADGRYYQGLMANLVRDLEIMMAPEGAAHDLPLRLALDLMDINRRGDAVFQRALEDKENAKTYARIATIDWKKYAYAVILVPGYSPEIAYEPLNPGAKLRIKRAVEMYRAGKAPLFIVSGGTLRPIGTTTNEALEMKKFMMATYAIPEDAILIDPVARHTTTNVRNAARLIYRHGIPADKMSVIAGNSVPYIASNEFEDRCIRELGYVPFAKGARVSFDGLEFKPRPVALHLDAHDPMDP